MPPDVISSTRPKPYAGGGGAAARTVSCLPRSDLWCPSAPTGDNYGRVSNSFFNAAHSVLSGDKTGAEAVSQLDSELSRIKRRRW